MSPDTHKRSVAKAITWRVTGTLDTFLISWVLTGEPLLATGIAGTELLTKIILFYLHERAWTRLAWGRGTGPDGGDARSRSIAKAMSWRTVGTIDTFLISWLVTGELLTATSIAGTEVLTKITLFYLHERAWTRIGWGRAGQLPSPASDPADAGLSPAAARG